MLKRTLAFFLFSLLALGGEELTAAERLCDAAFEDCRSPLITLIKNEKTGIDVAFWAMEDARYSAELIRAHNRGVHVRVLFDLTQGNATHKLILSRLKDAGIPMRYKSGGGILHLKMMAFASQATVEMSGANYTSASFVPLAPYVDYFDEVIYFSDDEEIVKSLQSKYDDLWVTGNGYADYANIEHPRVRNYPAYAPDSSLNLPPGEDFANKLVAHFNAEDTAIDAIIYRITDPRFSNALLAAHARGVQVRLISEPQQYRDTWRRWHAWSIDRMHAAGMSTLR